LALIQVSLLIDYGCMFREYRTIGI
jgi:hypothetical protein